MHPATPSHGPRILPTKNMENTSISIIVKMLLTLPRMPVWKLHPRPPVIHFQVWGGSRSKKPANITPWHGTTNYLLYLVKHQAVKRKMKGEMTVTYRLLLEKRMKKVPWGWQDFNQNNMFRFKTTKRQLTPSSHLKRLIYSEFVPC